MESFFLNQPLVVNIGLALLALFLLVRSSEWMIDGAVVLSKRLRISPLIIGATVVAMGTSMAELAVNLVEIFSQGHTEAVMGNVLGSNFVNLGLGLGISAIVATLVTKVVVAEKEVPMHAAATGLLTAFAADGVLSRKEGTIMVVCFAIILFLIYQYAIRERCTKETKEQYGDCDKKQDKHEEGVGKVAFTIGGGLFLLVLAARLLVGSGSGIALSLGVSKYIVGLTIVGIGTSFPEIVSSIQAARKGYTDIVLGNVFGSNIFNIFFGLGVPMMVKDLPVLPGAFKDMYFLNIFSIVVLFVLLIENKLVGKNKTFDALGGIVVVLIYLGYIGSKIMFPEVVETVAAVGH